VKTACLTPVPSEASFCPHHTSVCATGRRSPFGSVPLHLPPATSLLCLLPLPSILSSNMSSSPTGRAPTQAITALSAAVNSSRTRVFTVTFNRTKFNQVLTLKVPTGDSGMLNSRHTCAPRVYRGWTCKNELRRNNVAGEVRRNISTVRCNNATVRGCTRTDSPRQ